MSNDRAPPLFSLRVDIPWLPKSLNVKVRAGRYANDREMKAWSNYLSAELHSRKPSKPLTKARLTLIRHAWRTLDYDGLVGSFKPVVDGLVDAGIIVDDTWAVTGKWDCDQKHRPRKAGPLLEIRVDEILT